MATLITLNQLIVLILTNLISGVCIGFGIAVGMYRALKNFMPKWIHEMIMEQRKNSAIERALQGRTKYDF